MVIVLWISDHTSWFIQHAPTTVFASWKISCLWYVVGLSGSTIRSRMGKLHNIMQYLNAFLNMEKDAHKKRLVGFSVAHLGFGSRRPSQQIDCPGFNNFPGVLVEKYLLRRKG